ncbi:hypothetical protein C8Q80DRAFT_1203623 [Daedaleopsis nitida]|nr:hypothetical protein C8Q80DRAFT_1203623 [Daedaleopsis nitida]
MHLSEAERSQFRLEPTPELIQSVHRTIQRHEKAIDALEDRIQRFLGQVRELQYDQAKHRAAIARCCGLITLARRLPEELLIKIFGHCVESGWTRAPVVVSHVCSAWRKAAQAPQVWSHIYVRCDDANVYDRTRFWLTMARRADLHVTVAASHHVPEWRMYGLLDLLKARSEQWSSLKIDTDTLRHAGFILFRCHGSTPNLRHVEIRTDATDSADAGGELNLAVLGDMFTTDRAPRLTSVAYYSSVVPAVPIFPAHINDLTLEIRESPAHRPLSAALLIGILEPLLELRNLTVTMPLVYEQPFVPEADQSRVVSLPDLTMLTLYGPTDLNELLLHLHTPALRRLHLRSLEDAGYRQQPIGPSLTRYLEQSAPPLELLELHDIDLAPETFATCFGALPALRELRLHESSISDATLGLLRGPCGLCPRLARLDLRWCGLLHGRALVDLVRSRHVVTVDDRSRGLLPGPIEEVGVINCCFVEERDVLDLARMAVCRIVTRDGEDYCRPRDCCSNGRYRTRFRLRHMPELIESRGSIRLIL